MSNKSMVDFLTADGVLKTSAIIQAFLKVDRKDFVPESSKDQAYNDYPLPVGFGQTISQPWTVAFMLELLEPKLGQKILDIGSGSGWQSCLLAEIVGPPAGGGRVIAVERINELKELGEQNAQKYNFRNLIFINQDASKGVPEFSLYDRIIAAASAKQIPQEWLYQLKEGGILVGPVASRVVKIKKLKNNNFEKQEFEGFAFVPFKKD